MAPDVQVAPFVPDVPVIEAAAPRGWRKRHPALARSLLYGTGAVLVLVAALLLVKRAGDDRSDRDLFLSQVLDGLDLVFRVDSVDAAPGSPGGWQVVLQTLDEHFGDPDIGAPVRFRALRWRGVAQVKGGNLPAAEEAFRRAMDLAASDLDRGAVLVEWAEARAHLGAADASLALLERPEVATTGVLRTLGAVVRSYALERAGRRADAADGLRTALSGPQDAAAPTLWVGSRSWTTADAVEAARTGLARLDEEVVQNR